MKKQYKNLAKVIEKFNINIEDFYCITIRPDGVSMQGHDSKNKSLIAQLRKAENVKEKEDGFFRVWYKKIEFVFTPLI